MIVKFTIFYIIIIYFKFPALFDKIDDTGDAVVEQETRRRMIPQKMNNPRI